MDCPYCSSEMAKGRLIGDGRAKVRWQDNDEKFGFIDRSFTNKGCIEAYYSFSRSEFQISGYFCEKCEKIIINAKPKK